MDNTPETNTLKFLSKVSSFYKDTLPQLSRQINLDRELVLDTDTYTKDRCKKHCPRCYTLFVAGVNYSVRIRSLKQLGILRKKLKIESVTGYGNNKIVFSRRRLSYWTILCRVCKVLFVDFSHRKRRRGPNRMKMKQRFSKLSLATETKRKLSRKKRAKKAKIKKTKMRFIEKRDLQYNQPKPMSLTDFLIDCDVKL